ncbi:MAG: fumarylacetoacetate hydrolase family protein [Acidimicrobiales bacterium]|jgi:2-keto-4-pentenoate hydratase/2-oxohepta-3-ene-1,7-dioic acid hydratase in catechol pathway
MRLVSFVDPDEPAGVRTGVVVGDEVVDLTDPSVALPGDMTDFLVAGPAALERADAAVGSGARRLALAGVRLRPPVPHPVKVLGIGLNYGAHVAETGATPPEYQVWFNKQRTCVIGPGEAIEIPRVSPQVDYEGELAMVVGRRARHVALADAPSVVAGFTVCNDVTVRDWQWRTPTWTLGKSFDTHGPIGPWIVTGDEVGDPHRLRLRTWVNGDLRQDASTDDMIFSCWEQIAYLSTVFTLEPGDIISTGTPAGVGMGFDPPRWLVEGDVVRIEVERVGTLENHVVVEPTA